MVFDFYPRPPRGGRLSIMGSGQGAKKFLSTPSARRATSQRLLPLCPALYFYPRPPRGGRPGPPKTLRICVRFLSTPSARRATALLLHLHPARRISIHALREEGDVRLPDLPAWPADFYPRPPRGGRPTLPGSALGVGLISIHALREEGDPRKRPMQTVR